MPLSPLAPSEFPTLPPLAGVRLAAAECGIRYKNRLDVLLAEFTEGTTVAGVFTRSLTSSASVDWCKDALELGTARVLVVNSGNANAFTGKHGDEAVNAVATKASELFGCETKAVYQSSTGVIAEKIPYEKITAALPALKESLSDNAWNDAARAIMTTDTFPKCATRTAMIGDKSVTINGIAKGSGMIAPDMATMLAYVATDAKLPAKVLHILLTEATRKSFNCITVDSDTSTSDMALLFATGQAEHAAITSADDKALADFKTHLNSLMVELAQLIVKDGEGATKFVTITVTGAESDKAAHCIALSIGNSPLVKTAIAGEDANWGRIVMAVGKAGEKADRDKLSITIGGHAAAREGQIAADYDEQPIAAHMKTSNITIAVDVGVGKCAATIWTCDLTHGYIDINGSYRS